MDYDALAKSFPDRKASLKEAHEAINRAHQMQGLSPDDAEGLAKLASEVRKADGIVRSLRKALAD